MSAPRYFLRSPYFEGVEELLGWADAKGGVVSTVCYVAYDGRSVAGSIELASEDDLYPEDSE